MAISDWVMRENGDIWSSANERTATPVAYRVGDGWMVSGVRTLDELLAIVRLLAVPPDAALCAMQATGDLPSDEELAVKDA